MTSTITKISLVAVFVTVAFGVFGYMSNSHIFINEAVAQSSCGDCGGGGTGGGSTGGSTGGGGGSTPVKPVCNLSVNVTEVSKIGDPYRITWNGTPTSAKFYINGSAVAASGHSNFTFTGPNYDRFKMTGNNNGATCEAEVQVNLKKPAPAPTCDSFVANPATIQKGQSAGLKWETTNATKVTINQGIGAVAVDSGRWVSPLVTTTYTLTATNADGKSVTCTAKVTVTEAPKPAPTCDSFTATPVSIQKGQSATLKWATTNATTVTINNGIGSVAVDGSRGVTPTVTTTYTLTATNADGKSVTCAVKVTVTETKPAPTCDSFTATPAAIQKGQSATLTWATTNATTVTINNGIGSVAVDGSRSVAPTVTTTYTLTATNADGKSVTCATKVTVTETKPAPTCDSFTATPVSIQKGQSATLNWATTNATTVTINQGIGSVAVDGSRSVAPTVTTTYTLTATNADGVSVTCAVKVTVTDTPPPPAPTCDSFTATPASIQRGQSSTLTWETTNATNVTINQGIGSVPVDGTRSVSPTETTTYTLTATGQNGAQVTCTRTITVTDLPAPSCDSFTVTPSEVKPGQQLTAAWQTTNALRITLVQGSNTIGDNLTADSSINFTAPNTVGTYTYTLTVRGENSAAVTCTDTVVVKEDPKPVFTCENNVRFSASDTSIDEGDSATLTWDTTGATSVSINNGVQSTSLDGSEAVSPRSNTTYTLTASNGTDTVSCPLTINVDEEEEDNDDDNGGSSSPKCELEISEDDITSGDRVTLTWETTNATEVILKDDNGKTLMTTEDKLSSDKKELYDGEITLRPTEDTTYTLTAEKGSKERVCKVSVDVSGGLTIITDNDQDLVGDIIIGELPYTGFEAGPFLTMLFYGLLLAWALYLAYVLVIRRGGFGQVATATVNPVTPAPVFGEERVVAPHAVETINPTPTFVVPAPVVASTAAPVVGYAAMTDRDASYDVAAAKVEAIAHAAHVLLSSDAMRLLIENSTESDRTTIVNELISAAKASYPSEDGWVVITAERMEALAAAAASPIAAPATTFTPATVVAGRGNSSLAEAMATGNIVAAYQLIGHRPMVALADAAAELDMLYRAKQGATVPVSDLLSTATANTSATQVKEAINALTSALDGVYTDEAEAVKIAIMKAVKALS